MFTYFTETIVLIFLGYSMVYPLLLFIAPSNQIDKGFYRFNLGKCCIIGAIGIIGYHSLSTNLYTEIYLLIWFLMLMSITAIYWNSKQANNFIISIISFIGLLSLRFIMPIIIPNINPDSVFLISILNSLITSSVFFAMILGHWYLNVVDLPINLLKRATLILSFFLSIRILWDSIYFFYNYFIDSYGISYNLWSFLFQFEGFLLGIAFFIGNVFPILLNIFIIRTLKLQATQSATGLLYVSIVSILFSDLIFKYYLVQYGFIV